MSGLKLTLRQAPSHRVDLSRLLDARSTADAERIPLLAAGKPLQLGDLFSVSGTPGETLTIEGGSDRLDFVGANNTGIAIVVDGDAGEFAGRRMSAGSLDIRGNAGAYLASGAKGGKIAVDGSAGEYLGGPIAGDRFGIEGGTIFVGKDIGARAGERMRRGTIVARGSVGPLAGPRMMGGTIWATGGFSDLPGPMMRRGTLIGASASRIAATFADCGHHDLVILRILARYLKNTLGPLAPDQIPGRVQRFAGDMASLGRGELLLYG